MPLPLFLFTSAGFEEVEMNERGKQPKFFPRSLGGKLGHNKRPIMPNSGRRRRRKEGIGKKWVISMWVAWLRGRDSRGREERRETREASGHTFADLARTEFNIIAATATATAPPPLPPCETGTTRGGSLERGRH